MISPMSARAAAKATLSKRRFFHTRCVAEAAFKLAVRYGADVKKALAAAYLHDIAKELPKERMLQMISGTAIINSIDFERAPGVAHAFAGEIAARQLGVDDAEVLSAIRYHTTGHADMTKLEKIVFIADFTGRDRKYPEAAEARRLAKRSLGRAAFYILDGEVSYWKNKKDGYIINLTQQARDYLDKEING